MKMKNKTPRYQDYEKIRNFLIKHNFVIKILHQEITKRIKKGERSQKYRDYLTEDNNKDHILGLLEIMTKHFLIGGNPDDTVFVKKEQGVKITRPGIYIRFHPLMTEQEWIYRREQVAIVAKLLKIYEGENEKKSEKPKQRHDIGLTAMTNINLYLKIEKRLPKLWRKQQDYKANPYKYTQGGPGNERKRSPPIVLGAIEAILESKGIRDKKNLVKKRYKNIYYDVARRYRLPTLYDLPKYIEILDPVFLKP